MSYSEALKKFIEPANLAEYHARRLALSAKILDLQVQLRSLDKSDKESRIPLADQIDLASLETRYLDSWWYQYREARRDAAHRRREEELAQRRRDA